jgi:hypothetical protein
MGLRARVILGKHRGHIRLQATNSTDIGSAIGVNEPAGVLNERTLYCSWQQGFPGAPGHHLV